MRGQQQNILDVLIRVAEKLVGPKPEFELTDIVKLFIILGEGDQKGRKSLSKDLQIGEGSIRTLLNRLREHNLVKVERGGCSLTESGRAVYKALIKMITPPKPVEASPLAQWAANYAILVRKSASKIRSGLEQRDAAVRVGALGATTLLYLNGCFSLPGVDVDVERTYRSDFWNTLRSLLKPEDGDSVIIVGAASARVAEKGAVMAALQTLLSDLPHRQKI